MAVGQTGVLLEIAPSREEVAREHVIEIVTPPSRLDKDYHVMDPNQRQEIAEKINVLVDTLDVLKTRKNE